MQLSLNPAGQKNRSVRPRTAVTASGQPTVNSPKPFRAAAFWCRQPYLPGVYLPRRRPRTRSGEPSWTHDGGTMIPAALENAIYGLVSTPALYLADKHGIFRYLI